MPIATTVVKTDAITLTFTGTNFFTSGFTAQVTFGGVTSDSVLVSSSTSAIATFNNGVPLTTTSQIPKLYFAS